MTRRIVKIATAQPRRRYDCGKCPAYCCTYPLIEVTRRDIARLAKHHGLGVRAAQRTFARYDRGEGIWVLRHRRDTVFTTACRFLDRETRRCTVYEARPRVCRSFPESTRCGYWEFLRFEREQQGDPEFIALT